MPNLVTTWRSALVGEVCWLGPGESPEGMPAIPLVLDDVACLALPYADRAEAFALSNAAEVAFVVTEQRSLPAGTPGVAAFGDVTVAEDLDGSVFTDTLLAQELTKYPPARTLADSPLLRRENWWYLPRVIVRLEHITRTVTLAPRTDASGQALLVRDGTGLRVDTVSSDSWARERPLLVSLAAAELRGDGASALVFGHDYTVPDLERWETWKLRGRLLGDEFPVEERSGTPGASLPPLGLITRIRRQRALERDCRRALAEAEREKR